jgi:hypothetical protein
MSQLLAVLAAVEAEEETSKTLFYVMGGLLVVWAVLLGVGGITRPSLTNTDRSARGVIGVTALLVVGACASAVITG